ncbi:MAG: hypothetical protein KC619_11075 [Myxococcales bacterium]|nr:hypothetical protein [Myxococcales bacterium]
MATIDEARGVLVVRIVYDGPPLSGKTTTLRRLADILGVAIHSPEEHEGRTLFFDWVEYVGGLFEGRPIHCQIVSVPGQEELASRRRVLLESADAVVLVADTRASSVEEALRALEASAAWCRAQEPPVGMVLQANKRDDPDAVPRTTLVTRAAEIAPIAIVETVATEGDGVRESFVFGVRLALDRARALAEAGALVTDRLSPDAAADLLSSLTDLPVAPLVASPATDVAPTVRSPSPAEHEAVRFVADPQLPSGMVWPPVDGRALLQEVSWLDLRPRRLLGGGWLAEEGGWRCHSRADTEESALEEARASLIARARALAARQDRLSRDRVVVLCEREGRYRLWELMRTERTLAQRLAELEPEAPPDAVARLLRDAGDHLCRAHASFTADPVLPCTAHTVGGDMHRSPVFADFLPPVDHAARPLWVVLEEELGPVVAAFARDRPDFGDVRGHLRRAFELRSNNPTLRVLVRLAGVDLG